MAYVAVKGGREAIDNSIAFMEARSNQGSQDAISLGQIKGQLHFLVDKVMGEGSLYAPDLAALAIKQSGGDVLEAAFMVRAYRTTLPRLTYSLPQSTGGMRIVRRISSAFKDIPGGQFLGPSPDYTLRLLDFDLADSQSHVTASRYQEFLEAARLKESPPESFPKLVEILRREQLLVSHSAAGPARPIRDITRESLSIPAERSAALQTLARGETGGMLALAYSNMRGYGSAHPTIGELRIGYLPVNVKHPFENRTIDAGDVMITEAEIISGVSAIEGKPKFQLGYGVCFGHNETKAISMATLDIAMRAETPQYPSEDQEFVLMHIDGIEAMGFANHFKLPHYVTFQSELDRLRQSQRNMAGENPGDGDEVTP